MEELDDDDFSDLYADVEVQASSAIRALHGFTEMARTNDVVLDDAIEKGKCDEFNGSKIAGGNGGIYEHDAGGEEGGGLTECGGARETEDDLVKLKFDDNNDNGKYGSSKSSIGSGVRNFRKNGADEKKRMEIDGNEKSVNVGEYSSRRKVHKRGKNADADERDICSSSASEDNPPSFRRNDAGGKVASTRSSMHTHAWDPPSDLDKYGSVQISDSVEDNHHEVSDYDSDGMLEAVRTSDDAYRRSASFRSNKVPSPAEQESSQSGRIQHGPSSSSPSSTAAFSFSDDDTEKGHKHSKNRSSILFGESEEAVTHECHPSKYSRSHTMKSSIRDGRECQRQRGLIRKELDQHNKSNDMPDLKTRMTDEDASYAIDIKRPYNRHISHGRRRAMLNFNSNEKDMPYFYQSQSESFFSGFRGFFPHYHLGPAYLTNQNWNVHPSYGCKAGRRDGYNMSGRQDFIEKRSSKRDYEATGDDWYHKQRRRVVQDNIVESEKLIPKYYSSVNARATQFSNKGDALRFRRTKRDHLSPIRDYNNDREGKSRRFMPSSDRHRDYLDHRYGQNIAHERREMESSIRRNRKSVSPRNSSDNLWFRDREAENNVRRCTKNRPPFFSHEDPFVPGRGRFKGADRPKSGFLERNVRCSSKEMHIECGQYDTETATFGTREGLRCHLSESHHVGRKLYKQPANTFITDESIKGHYDRDHFVGRRHHQQPEVLHSREEVYRYRQQDDTIFHSEGSSYHFQRISRSNRHDDRHAFGRKAEHIDEREVDRHRFKMIREEFHRNQFDGCLKFIQADNSVQMSPRNQYSVDPRLVVGKKCPLQSSRRTSEGGDDFNCGKHDLREWNGNQKPKKIEDLGDYNREKAALTNERKVDTNLSVKHLQDNFSENQQDEFLDIEEGQIISDEINDHPLKCAIASEDMTQINDMGIPETASNDIKVVEELGDQKILEIMAKMERRRERFKEPVTSGRGSEKNSNQSLHLAVETAHGKLERPARKRKWFGT